MISIALASPLVLFALPSEGSPLPPSRLARAEWIQLSPDDLPHLWLQHEDGRYGLFRWTDGSLTDASAEKGWDTTRAWAATAWGDADGDDLPDLLALRTDGVVSWWSNRDGILDEVPQELIADPALRFSEVSWVDVDADGRDEMWLFGQRPLLLRIDGASSPTPVPLELAATPTFAMRGAGGRPATTPASGSIAAAPDAALPRSTSLPTQLPGPGGGTGPAALVEGPDGGEPVFDALEASPLAAFDAFCLETIADQASNACLLASSQPLLGALYPLSLDFNLDADGRVGMGTTSPTEARLHVLEDALTGDAIHAETAVGGAAALTAISSSVSDGFGIKAEANSGVGRAVRGVNEAAGGNGIGVEGVSRSNTGRAVVGIATNPTGPNFGVFGETLSSNGTAILGQASSSSGPSVGVRGVSDSTDFEAIGVEGVGPTGVRGEGSLFGVFGTTPGLGWGVVGESQGLGTGVVGESAQGTGIAGATQGADAVAISGTATNSSSGAGVGVRGESLGPDGVGVHGLATNESTNATGTGVLGQTSSELGAGVQGWSGTPPQEWFAAGVGVFGHSDKHSHAGVRGLATGPAHTGIAGIYDEDGTGGGIQFYRSGVSGSTTSTLGVGVGGFHASSEGEGSGVTGTSSSSEGAGVSGVGHVGVRGYGDVFLPGTPTGVHGSVGLDIRVDGSGVSGSSSMAPGVTGWTAEPSDQPAVLGVHDDGDLGYEWVQPSAVCGTTDVQDAVGVAGWSRLGTSSIAGVIGAVGPDPDLAQDEAVGVYGTTSIPSSTAIAGANPVGGAGSAGVIGSLGPEPHSDPVFPAGVFGRSTSGSESVGVAAYTTAAQSSPVYALSNDLNASAELLFYGGTAVTGFSTFDSNVGVRGVVSAEPPQPSATGVRGEIHTLSSTGNGVGVLGVHPSAGDGVRGTAGGTGGTGVRGTAAAFGLGVVGECGFGGTGVYGDAGGAGTWGVYAFGDSGASGVKSFVHPHPHDPSKEIRYVSLEGNEVGTYFRGTTQLVGGRAVVAVPEDFRLVTEPAGLSVQLTPRGGLALLAVASESLDEIVVIGEPDVEFHYLVQGVRSGYADHEPMRANTSFVPRERGKPFGAQLPEGVRRNLVTSGILNEDYTPDETTATALGWTLREPVAEIEEPGRVPVQIPNAAHSQDSRPTSAATARAGSGTQRTAPLPPMLTPQETRR